jgi:hypothetical protein
MPIRKTIIREQYLYGDLYEQTIDGIEYKVEVLQVEPDTWETYCYANGVQNGYGIIGSYKACVRDANDYLASRPGLR